MTVKIWNEMAGAVAPVRNLATIPLFMQHQVKAGSPSLWSDTVPCTHVHAVPIIVVGPNNAFRSRLQRLSPQTVALHPLGPLLHVHFMQCSIKTGVPYRLQGLLCC